MLRLRRTRREEHESDLKTLELLRFVGLTRRANELSSSLPYGERASRDRPGARHGPRSASAGRTRADQPAEKIELAELIRKSTPSLVSRCC